MLTAPIDQPVNLLTQAILSYGSWSLTAAILIIAIRKDQQQHRPFYSLLVLAGLVAAFAEPLYDVGFTLWFYAPGQWTVFSAYQIPQPNWTFSGYTVLYSGTAMYICESLRKGISPQQLLGWGGIALAMSMAFETIGINGGAYTYWGAHVLRIFDYPIAIGILEATQVLCYSVAAHLLRTHTQGIKPLFGLFILFPCTFYLVNFGAGSPLIIALHLDPPIASPLLSYIGTLTSILFASVITYTVITLAPTVGSKKATSNDYSLSGV
ncbi:MAG: hypothetical protein WCY88_14580 [Spongiibacteraceae bacterium]